MNRRWEMMIDDTDWGTHEAPTNGELIGLPSQFVGRDFVGNECYPPHGVPARTQLPGRGRPDDSLDRFSPGWETPDFDWELSDDSDLATPEEISDPVVEANSQRNLVDDCPSTQNPHRFVWQGGAKGPSS